MNNRRNLLLNGRQIAKEIFGGSMDKSDYTGEWIVYAVKKANAIAAKEGKEELIFAGRYSTPAKVSDWLAAHPDFIAARVLQKPKDQSLELQAAAPALPPHPQHRVA